MNERASFECSFLEYNEVTREEDIVMYETRLVGPSNIAQGYRVRAKTPSGTIELVVNGPGLSKARKKLARELRREEDARKAYHSDSYILHANRREMRRHPYRAPSL